MNQLNFDVLVIGSGAAGLSLALEVADFAKVAVLSKATINAGSTNYAQGGVSAVLDKNDSFEAHISDTLIAGAGLCDKDIVNFTVSQGPDRIQTLIERGVPFTQEIDSEGKKAYHLTRRWL